MTTNEIGRLVGVSERTVANWIDRGYLPAFRTPGGHRRVDPKVLTGFLVERGIPVPESLDTRPLVLIVEDDVQVAETLRSYLEQPEGRFNVHVIHDGVSALIHIGNKKPKLVLLDVVMPGMDGIEVAKKIRANPELSDTKVLFVTARHDLDSAEIIRETGAWGFVSKPVRRGELVDIVNTALFKSTPAAVTRP
jgi:excisionase family DNA binding protein